MTASKAGIRWHFHRAAEWPALAAQWDALNAVAGQLPFLESAFLTPLLAEFGRGDETIALGRCDGVTVAGALLVRAGPARVATFQPSQLPLGPWLVAAGVDSEASACSLLEQMPGLPLGLGLTQIDPRLWARPADGARLDTLDYIETGWVDVSGSFDAYWDARGKNLRSNMRKQRSKLQSDGVSIVFDALCAQDDVAGAIAEYGRLEGAGWKAGMGTAVRADNAQGRFYAAMLRNFCALGRARIWRLKFDDRVVAMDLCIEGGDTMVILKTAFDPEYRQVSPAFLMRQEAFRDVFGQGRVRRIEFYGRMMEWHTRWTEHSRTLYHVNLYRWAIISRVRRELQRLSARRQPKVTDAAPSVPAT